MTLFLLTLAWLSLDASAHAQSQSQTADGLSLEIRLEGKSAAVILHPTIAGGRYHILSKSSLAQPSWQVECQLTGAAGRTTTLIPLSERPMLFLRAAEGPGPSGDPNAFNPAAPAPCPSAVDAMLVLDVSQSLSATDFLRAREVASNFVHHLDLGVDRVGLISFAGGALLEQSLTHDGRSVQTNILGLGLRSGTVLKPALDLAQAQLAASASGTLRLVVVMSDGRMESPTLSNSNLAVQAAAQARASGTRIITIAYGNNGPGTNLMKVLASSPQDFYHAPTVEELSGRFAAMASSLCRSGSGNRVPRVTLVTPTNAARFPDTTLAVQARAADSDGTISLLEVWEGDQIIGSGPGTNLVFLWHPERLGSFTLKARAVDNLGASASSVPATVQVAYNTGPQVEAGLDQAITLTGTNPATVYLNGAVTDPDNLPPGRTLQIAWSVVSGPGPVTLAPDPAALGEPRRARATLRSAGTYTLRLQASDSLLGSSDEMQIIVSATNQAPLIHAGPDQTIVLPDPVYLPGAISDDGLPSGRIYATWCGPNGANGVEFANPSSTNTFARFNAPGVYRLLLTARDGADNVGGLASTQAVTITVKAITEPLVINDVDEVSVGVGGLRGFWNHYNPLDPETINPLQSPQPGCAEMRLEGLSGPVRRAYLYWHGPLDPANGSINAGVTVNGRRVSGVDLGGGADNGWTYQGRTHRFSSARAWRAEITALVNTFGAGPYLLSNFVKGAEVEANGASLLAFYEDADPANNHDYILVGGNDSSDSRLFYPQWADVRHPASLNALAPAGGGFYIGGRFRSAHGPGRNGIARLQGLGTLDTAFAPELGVSPLGQSFSSAPLYEVETVAVQPDGKVLVGGAFQLVEGQARTNLARYLADGALDRDFNVRVDGPVHVITLDPTGRLLLGGGFTQVNGQGRRGLARLSASGELEAFAPEVEGAVHALGLLPNGQILIAGDFARVSGVNRGNIARLQADGTLDQGFHAEVRGLVRAVLVRSNATIVIGGDFWGVEEVAQAGVALLQANGTMDLNFRPDLTGTRWDPGLALETGRPRVHALAEHGGGLLVAGRFVRVNGQDRARLARLLEDGALDARFDPGAGVDPVLGQDEETRDVTVVRALAVQPDGTILIGGCFETMSAAAFVAKGVARLQADGSLDPTFTVTDSGWNVPVSELNYGQGELSLELHVSDGQPAQVTKLFHGEPLWSSHADAPVQVNGVPWLEPEITLSGNGRADDWQNFAGVTVPNAGWPAGQLAGLWDIVRRPLPAAVLHPGLTQLTVRAGSVADDSQDAISIVAVLAQTAVGQTRRPTHPPVLPPAELPPVAWPDRFAVRRGVGRQVLDVLHNDISRKMLVLHSVSRPAQGSAELVLQASAILYTAPPGGTGRDTFTYVAMEPNGHCATGSVTVQLIGPAAPARLIPGVLVTTNLSIPWNKNTPIGFALEEAPRKYQDLTPYPGFWPNLSKSSLNDTNSTRGEGQFARFYTFEASAGDTITLTLDTTQFLSHLYLRDPLGELIASANHLEPADPLPLPPTTILTQLIGVSGTYHVEVTSHAPGETGDFTLQLEVDSPSTPKLELIVDGLNVPDGGTVDLGLQSPGSQKSLTLRNAGRRDVPLVGPLVVETFNGPRQLNGATLYPGRLLDLRAGAAAALTLNFGDLDLTANTVQIRSPQFSASLNMEAKPPGPQPPEAFFIESPTMGSRLFTPGTLLIKIRVDPNLLGSGIELFSRSAGRQQRLGLLTMIEPDDFAHYTLAWADPPAGVHQLYARAIINGSLALTAPVVIEVARPIPNRSPLASNDVVTVSLNSHSNRLELLLNDRDPDEDPLRLINVSAAAGRAFTDGAAVFYTPPADGYGLDYIQYRISDGRGGLAQAMATVQVVQQPVRLEAPLDLSIYQTHTVVPLRALAATVLGAISRVEFFANGSKIAEAPGQTASASYNATWQPAQPGNYLIKAVAIESTGARLVSDPVRVRVATQQNPGPDAPPLARIVNVSENQWVRSGFLEVRGTATDADDPLTYRLNILRPADDTVLVTMTGETPVNEGVLGTLDLTLLRNGAYLLELVVTAGFGQARHRVPFLLESQAKIGQLSFSEQDLVLPVGGFPIAIVRTYDSINPAPGDFGPGWTLALNDVELELDEVRQWTPPDEDNTEPEDLLSMRVGGGRNLTLTLPEGRRTTFRYSEVTGPSDGELPCFCYRARWTPPPGVQASITPLDLDTFSFIPYQSIIPPYWDAALGTPLENFDFRGFILTNAEGTRYDITRPLLGTVTLPASGEDALLAEVPVRGPGKLTRITRRNGERLELRPDGIDHFYEGQNSRTASIHLARDPDHRIIAIHGPDTLDATGQPKPGSLPVLRYEYYPPEDPSAGQLARVLRLSNPTLNPTLLDDNAYDITLYLYENPAQPRLLTATIATNPVTHQVRSVRHEFDADGRWIGSRDPSGQRTELHHVPGRGQSVITDAAGHATLLEYDPRGNVTRTVDPLGHAITRDYDDANQLRSETDPLGHTTRYEYDARGQRTLVIDPLGHTNKFTFDPTGQLLTALDARGHGVTNSYDPTGHLLQSIDALGQPTTFAYDARGQLITQTDALGTMTTNHYDDQGRLIFSATWNLELETWNSTVFTHDVLGNLLTESTLRTGPDGLPKTVTTAYAYDARNRLIATTNDVGELNLVTSQTYNELGQMESRTDPARRVTRSFYDNRGNVIQSLQESDGQTSPSVSRTVFDELNRPLYVQDRLEVPPGFAPLASGTIANATHYIYDAAGRLLRTERLQAVLLAPTCLEGACSMRFVAAGPEIIEEGFEVRGEPFLSATSTEYDEAGRVRAVTDARGSITRYDYDEAGRRTHVIDALGQSTQTAYDANGNQTGFTDAMGHKTISVYDALNRRVELRFPDNTVQRTLFDALGRRVAEIDPLGVTHRYAYDTLGRLIAVTNAWATPAATWSTYTYDESGQMLTQTDALGRTTHFAYDTQGHRVRRTLPGNQSEGFLYDPITGLLLAHTNFNGQIITNLYDTQDRLLSRWHGNQLLEAFTYNPQGQRATTLDASGPTLYTYDALGRLATNTSPEGELRYRYDPAGQLRGVQSTTANGIDLHYDYDALNRLTNVAAVGQASSLSSYHYDDVGNLASVETGNPANSTNRVQHRYRYDRLHRLTNLVVAAAPLTLAQFDYRLDAAGHRTELAESIQSTTVPTSPTQRQYHWRYDPLHRLTHETIALNGPSGPATGEVAYAYDPVGNRLTRSADPTRNPELGTLNAQSLSYGSNDWLSSDVYDANGNTATNGAYVYQYDWANRLTNAVIGPKTIAITYNANGHRVKKAVTESGRMTITRYLVDDRNPTGYAQVLEEHTTRNSEPGTHLTVYTYGLDLISQTTTPPFEPAITQYLVYDGHGSTRLLLNESGGILETYTYDAYGNLLLPSSKAPDAKPQTLYLYSGEQWDPDLGLYYNRARYLSPDTGRFWSMDSYEGNTQEPLSLHKYLYCHSNPVNRIDPSGHESLVSIQFTTAIILQFLAHDLRTGHSLLSAAETMFGADEQTHNLIYGLDVTSTTTDVAGLVAGGVAVVTVGYKAVRHGIPAIIRGGTKFAKYLARLAKEANGGKVVALGLEPHLGQYADAVDYTFFTNGSKELEKWKAVFNEVMASVNNKIVFILDDVDVWPGVQRAASGRGGATDWELLAIKENPQWWDRITWTSEGVPVPNPFK